MTLLSIAREMSVDVAEGSPDTVQDAKPFSRMAVQFINETGRDLARRVDWNALRVVGSIAGDGATPVFQLPANFARLAQGLSVSVAGAPVRGSLSIDEWTSLDNSSGTPRYFYLAGSSIGFYPLPASGQAVQLSYISTEWAEDAEHAPKSSMSLDGDLSKLPDDLLVKGAVWRWLRHAGRDYSDHMAEYEAAVTDLAKASNGLRQP